MNKKLKEKLIKLTHEEIYRLFWFTTEYINHSANEKITKTDIFNIMDYAIENVI